MILCVSYTWKSFATNYYVSSSGDDNNLGTSESQPWKTLVKVNSFTPVPGDQILFRRGDEWRGTITVKVSGKAGSLIVYGAYGTGEKPKICGSEKITGWVQYSGNIYKASVDGTIGQLFLDGYRIRPARFPNEGYAYINSNSGNTQFTSDELDASIDYTGAKWFGRTIYYLGVLKDVIASSSKTLTLDSAPESSLGQDEGFFLMNKLEFLDMAGEWYYESKTKSVYLWTPNGDSPANYTVTGSVYSNGFYSNHIDYISIQDLEIREQNENGIDVVEANGFVIENNTIVAPDRYGILGENGSSQTIANNMIKHANAGGIWVWINNSHIVDNTIDSTAMFRSLGLKGTTFSNGGTGAEINGDGNIIEYNDIENSNYNGLFYRGKSSIQYNYIKNSCLWKNDGGAIYTNTLGSNGLIEYNIIENTIGNPEGYTLGRGIGNGIYIDETAKNVTVENNTVLNSGSGGIFLHNVENIQVRYNTVMSARYGLQCNVFAGTVPSGFDHNIIYLTSDKDDYEPRQLLVGIGTYNAKFDYNLYIDPHASSKIVKIPGSYLDFTQWQTAKNQDAHSIFDGTPLASDETYKLFYNRTKSTKTYYLNGAVAKDVFGSPVPEIFSLEPFTSAILVGKNLYSISDNVTVSGEIRSNSSMFYFPNPFHGQTRIEFRGSNRNTTIDIINISGELVQRIYNGYAGNEMNTVIWNGKNRNGKEVPPGIYFIHMVSGNTIDVGKLCKSK